MFRLIGLILIALTVSSCSSLYLGDQHASSDVENAYKSRGNQQTQDL